jgi:hypothetical protein
MARFTSPARRRAGHAKPAVNPIACGSNPVPSPATEGALNPAPVGGHPAGQGSPVDSSKIVVLVRADQDAVFRELVRADQAAEIAGGRSGPRGPEAVALGGASWSTWSSEAKAPLWPPSRWSPRITL